MVPSMHENLGQSAGSSLPSPQSSGPGAGLRKWFYYPGFSAGTMRLSMAAQTFKPASITGSSSASSRAR